jgi:Flp pilus assembly pilin Flp
MVDVRDLMDQAIDTAEAGSNLAAQGIQATEALAEAVAATIRALPGKLRDVEVPRVRESLEQVAVQLTAMAVRLRILQRQLAAASVRLSDPSLQDSGKLIVEAFRTAAHVAELVRPDEAGWVRFVPKPLARPYLDGAASIEFGLAAVRDLARVCVGALPEIGNSLKDVAEDLGSAADMLDGTARAIRELANLVPSLNWRTELRSP